MTTARISKHFDDLVLQGQAVLNSVSANGLGYPFADTILARQWAYALAVLLQSVFTEENHLCREAQRLSAKSSEHDVRSLFGIAKAAQDTWNKGYVFDVRALVRADVESDLIAQATDLLGSGYDRAAAVVAGSTLEAHLRDLAPSWGVVVTDSKGKHLTLGPLAIELKKAGAFDAIMQKKIELVGGLRNEAAHGNPFENRAEDVQRMIADVLDVCSRVQAR